jgi:prepilin-type N-terminal cleavage/methylation domain-containing protein
MTSRTGNSGFSLIEVVMAVSVVAIGTIGVLRAYAGSLSVLGAGQSNIDGVRLLKQKMGEVEQTLLEQQEQPPKNGSGTFEKAADFSWQWDVSPAGTEGLNTLTMVVTNNNDGRTFSFETYVLDPKEEEEE